MHTFLEVQRTNTTLVHQSKCVDSCVVTERMAVPAARQLSHGLSSPCPIPPFTFDVSSFAQSALFPALLFLPRPVPPELIRKVLAATDDRCNRRAQPEGPSSFASQVRECPPRSAGSFYPLSLTKRPDRVRICHESFLKVAAPVSARAAVISSTSALSAA